MKQEALQASKLCDIVGIKGNKMCSFESAIKSGKLESIQIKLKLSWPL